MSDAAKIIKLLKDESLEKRIAAAIVLGELRVKGPEVLDGLMALAVSGVPLVQRHALEALTRIGGIKKAAPKLFPLLLSNDGDVRRAASQAIVSVGEDMVPVIKQRIASAEADERRALDALLASLGGKAAFSTLLAGLTSEADEHANAAAIAVRQRVKDSTAVERRSYLAETEKFLKEQKKKGAPPSAIAAAIKILGYLEDDRAIPTLLSFAASSKEPGTVRHEALIALRFALSQGKKGSHSKVVDTLIDAAGDADRAIAQTALHTLGSLELGPEHSKRLEKLVAHPDVERARFVIEQLGRQGGGDAARVLVKVLSGAEKRRAEMAAQALASNEDAVPLLARALLETTDPDRAWLVRNVLRPSAKKVSPQLRKQLLEAAMDRLSSGARGWEAYLDVARDADPESAAAALRALANKLRKAQDPKALSVLDLLCKTDRATDDDRYARASLELTRSGRDTRPAARAGDEALRQLGHLLQRGYDVAKALRADKNVGLEELYYLGFHFAEQGHPLGEELLGEVVKKGGRGKVAKMAKNKLALVEGA